MKTIKAFGVGIGAMLLLADAVSIDVMAACSNSAPPAGASVTCTGTGLSPVIAQTGSTNVAVDIATGAAASFVHATSAVAFSIEQASSVTNGGDLSLTGSGGSGTMRGAVLLGTGNGNQLINATGGMIRTAGAFNDGIAANGSGNTLTNQGSITTTGPNAYGMTAAWGQTNIGQLNNTLNNTGSIAISGSNARAASILGGNGTIDNSGTLSTTGPMSTTAYLQGNNDHLINSGSITATGAASDAVFSNTAGSNFTALIENRAGGRIVAQGAIGIRTLNGNTTIVNAGLVQSGIGSAIAMGNGNDSLILQTGSTIIGSADGGAGGNTVTLQGAGTADNAFTRFQTLLMQGTLWNWTGSGSFESARVQAGTLNLTGTLGAPASVAATVNAGATLQANAQNLPQSVVDNGLVRFAQQIDGSYTGLISGSGAVDKTGVGTLALAPAAAGGNTYAGGTAIEDGTLAIGADNALGAPSGGIAFNGGTLRLDQNLNLAATRAIVLNAAGGTIDTQSFNATLAQPVTGTGALTKTGSGSLSMTNISTYSGTTTVVAGTLAVGDAAHPGAALAGGGGASVAAGATLGGYGSVNGTVANSGTIAVANALAGFAGAPNGSFTVNGSLTNAALVRIGGESAGNQLRVAGAYVGQNGTIALNTVAGADNAASDRLVIDGGTGSGSTALQVANIGGTGAQTAANGIQVVQALNGATTVPSAFRLAAPFKAGAFTYYLAQGGVTSGTANDWFLRNTVAPLPATPAEPPTPGTQALPGVPLAAVGTPPLPPAPPPGADPIPLYRPEVPIYAAIPGVVRQIGMLQIDTFHDRQGDPSLLTGNGTLPAAWAPRVGQP